ncbi:hypothetical protein CXB51_009868 [Gossypium anomalum]|uniref:Aminotransferase-like plant mobile domain-containing protein n=1 Tax=Gossypium anomalum TaxID=47600 RepID=A0A8J6D1C1_9ROSI|nr:hypothetical protein CXB51_009868 [Gossypium anomalum]
MLGMIRELIRLDHKHISVEQMKMVSLWIRCYNVIFCNIFGPSSPLIENYLREADFWHVATIGRGCKLDPKLISMLIERLRPETHTFHLPSEECSITLEDVQLQLGLPVDGSSFNGSVQSADWGAICYDLLGAILDNIYGGRIEMGWLRDIFPESGKNLTEVERIQYARAYILEMNGSYLMSDLSRNLMHLRWLLKLVDFKAAGKFNWKSAVLATLYWEMCGATPPNKAKIGGCLSLLQSWAQFRFSYLRPRTYSASYVGIPTALEDIRLLLDQQSEAQFQWISYEDFTIRAVIPDEFFQNLNIWHVKVLLVNYATVEMYQTDRVLWQFGFRQLIPEALEVLDDEHKIDLRQSNMNWPDPWQAIFATERVEASTNSCRKGMGIHTDFLIRLDHTPVCPAHVPCTRPCSGRVLGRAKNSLYSVCDVSNQIKGTRPRHTPVSSSRVTNKIPKLRCRLHTAKAQAHGAGHVSHTT